MAISFGAVSAKTDATGASTVAATYPTGVAAGHLALAIRNMMSGVNTVTFLDEAGWSELADFVGGTGNTADNHNGRLRVGSQVLAGSESGTVTFDASANCSCMAMMARYSNGTGLWDVTGANGDDATHGANRSATAGTSLALAPGDVVVCVVSVDTDASLTITAPTITASGITFGTVTRRTSGAGSTAGLDGNIEIFDATVTAGTATVAPAFSMTTATSQCGPVAFVRLREASASSVTGSGAATATQGIASGAGTATTTGAGTVSAAAGTAAGAGTATTTGAGGASAQQGTAAGAGTSKAAGSGAAAAQQGAAAGAGTSTDTGSGGATGPQGSGSGAGTASTTGTGAASATQGQASGSGTATTSGAGAATAAPGEASGSSGELPPTEGTGAATGAGGAASGAGTATTAGTGQAAASSGEAGGQGTASVTGTGAATAPEGTATGEGIGEAEPAGPTPAARILTIPAELRALAIAAELRRLTIATDPRTEVIDPDSRALTIAPEPRTLAIQEQP